MPLKPIRLRADNFTPPTRTPWGGTGIVRRYKRFLLASGIPDDRIVGESWELSAGPEFPSRTEPGPLLSECIADDPRGYLGREAPRGGTALLVKWLDAADNLSVQIHPLDGDPRLAPDEAGKPECWYVVANERGAGLYVGLQDGVTEAGMRAALARSDDVSALLRFIEVKTGDFFVLDPGTPHAIGRGVMLLEPQFVAPSRRGVTFRYWDWNRRYDEHGRPSAAGNPRQLHVEEALAVTDFERANDPDWYASRWTRKGQPDLAADPMVTPLCGPAGDNPIESEYLQVARLAGTGAVPLPGWPALRAMSMLEGTAQLGDECTLVAGETAAIPAACEDLRVTLNGAHALLSAAR